MVVVEVKRASVPGRPGVPLDNSGQRDQRNWASSHMSAINVSLW